MVIFAMRICDEFDQSFSLSPQISRKSYDEANHKEKRGSSLETRLTVTIYLSEDVRERGQEQRGQGDGRTQLHLLARGRAHGRAVPSHRGVVGALRARPPIPRAFWPTICTLHRLRALYLSGNRLQVEILMVLACISL